MSDKDKPNEELYYLENGLIVFTAAYHLKRGYCCKGGCRHCPYDRQADKIRPTADRPDVGENGNSAS